MRLRQQLQPPMPQRPRLSFAVEPIDNTEPNTDEALIEAARGDDFEVLED